ncbi:hypothetical protein NE633_05550 [Phocaeicola vulgatus]|nr:MULTISPECIES: hypothetical protein [Bacteroides]MCQ5225378.1 hypothetical protein [Phocaeicola vulgatus]
MAHVLIELAVVPIKYATANDKHMPTAKAAIGGMAKCSEITVNIY